MNSYTLIAIAAVLGYWYSTQPGAAFAFGNVGDYAEPDQLPSLLEKVAVSMDPSSYATGTLNGDQADANVRAFLDTIAYAEGTAGIDGYRTMFGYRLFDDFSDHPRQFFPFTDKDGKELHTSAAGRYQIIVKTWDTLRARLGLADFSPASQDAACIELIRERGALADVQAGRLAAAAAKCAPIWASLPLSTAAQGHRTADQIATAFIAAGGTITA